MNENTEPKKENASDANLACSGVVMCAPVRVQRTRQKGFKLSEAAGNDLETVYVGRGSVWGNPYKADECEDGAKGAVRCFEILVNDSDENDSYNVNMIRRQLAGKNLACWCRLDQPCHADVLLELANT